MKKVLLLTATVTLVAFTSCKKEKDGIPSKVTDVVNQAGDAASDAASNVADAAGDAANAVADGVSNVYDNVSEATKAAWEDAKAAITPAPSFEDENLQAWANDLYAQSVKVKASAMAGSMDELQAAQSKITELAESLNNFKDSSEFSKAEAYYNSVKAELEK